VDQQFFKLWASTSAQVQDLGNNANCGSNHLLKADVALIKRRESGHTN